MDEPDFAARSHLLVQGEPGSGRTAMVRSVMRGLEFERRWNPAVVLTTAQMPPYADRIREVLERRAATPGTWQGPELFLIADDYADHVARPEADPLLPLADLLRHGAAIGVHVVLTGSPLLRYCTLAKGLLHDCRVVDLDETGERPPPDTGAAPRFAAVTELWHQGHVYRPDPDSRTALIGTGSDGGPVHLDVRRHAWIGGAVGSGKTALLRRIAHSLAARYRPDELRLMAIEIESDQLADLAALPHTDAYLSLPDPLRARDATALLNGLRGRGGPPLVVLIDRVGLLLAADPALAAEFDRMGRCGDRLDTAIVATSREPLDGPGGPVHRDRFFTRVSVRDHSRAAVEAALHHPVGRAPEPGEGLVRVGARDPRPFTVATALPQVKETEVIDARARVAYRMPGSWHRATETELDDLAAVYLRRPTSRLTRETQGRKGFHSVGPASAFNGEPDPADLEAYVRDRVTGPQGIVFADRHDLESRTLAVDGCPAATATVRAFVRIETGTPRPHWWWLRATAVRRKDGEVVVASSTVRAECDVRGFEDDPTADCDRAHESLTLLPEPPA
ncbi:FtsK/SpoIIIE domain-containing protein [Glycomyces sp. NPDC047010]|uniref:FtsK/SpoIIIE domain-containing protein n=1 Tax=Glycomyces sp. NPDC047010 TaxID=3155023 RepID=UPI0033F262B6